jgi:hypothetical protein
MKASFNGKTFSPMRTLDVKKNHIKVEMNGSDTIPPKRIVFEKRARKKMMVRSATKANHT